jgi:hypothetical protein
MPDFYNLCEDVKSTTQKIVNTVNEIKKLHVTILASPTTDNSMINDNNILLPLQLLFN